METPLELILKKIKRIEETLTGEIEGGFASIPPNQDVIQGSLRGNKNCKGANCIAGCGANHNYSPGCGVAK